MCFKGIGLSVLAFGLLFSNAQAEDISSTFDSTVLLEEVVGGLVVDREGGPCVTFDDDSATLQCARKGRCPPVLHDGELKKQLCHRVLADKDFCACYVPGFPYSRQ